MHVASYPLANTLVKFITNTVIEAMEITISSKVIVLCHPSCRRRSKRALRHPKVIFATSFVNPSADIEATPTFDNDTAHSDKSLLIVNEVTPGN